MTGLESLPLAGLLALGALHGINPAMGWLFAVALGMQEESGRAVWRALAPLALGHVLAVGAVVLVGVAVGWVLPQRHLRWLVAAVLVGFGVYRLFRRGHPRWVGMRVRWQDLVLWSALMASAHGAGLMVLPFVIGAGPTGTAQQHTHIHDTAGATDASAHGPGIPAPAAPLVEDPRRAASSPPGGTGTESEGPEAATALVGVAATLVHAASYLLVTGGLAILVYRKLGLRLLRRTWLNIDVIWAGVLILTGLLTPFV